jgi:SAM-dependent methyltransferase
MENPPKVAWAGYSIKEEEHLVLERKWAAQYYKILKKLHFVPCKRLLDIGCSRGFLLAICKQNGIEVNGIDVDPEIIDGKVVKRCNVETDRFPFDDNTFDIVWSAGLVQHLNKPPTNFMEEIYRVLKPGGKLCLSVRNEKSWINMLFSLYDNFRHKSTWSPVSLRQMFEYYNLKIIFMQPKFMGISQLWWLPFKWHIGANVFIVGQKPDKAAPAHASPSKN